jgi:hypothetical protein
VTAPQLAQDGVGRGWLAADPSPKSMALSYEDQGEIVKVTLSGAGPDAGLAASGPDD